MKNSQKLTALSVTAIAACLIAAQASADAFVTNGEQGPAHGVMNGYFVQVGDRTVCANPFAQDGQITCEPDVAQAEFQPVWASERGALDGIEVRGMSGELLCVSPTVWPAFRGPQSYLVCD